MKRISAFILAFLLLTSWAYGGVIHVIGSGVPSGGAGGTDYTDDASCQGAWLFNDNITDESGEGNTLTMVSEPGYTTTRPSGFSTGKSIHFDGGDDYLYRTDANLSANFPGKNGSGHEQYFACCCWFYKDDSGSADEFLLYKIWRFFFDEMFPNDDLKIGIMDDDYEYDQPVAYANVSASQWYHVCFSFAGAGGSGDGTGTYWISTDTGSFGDVRNGTTETFTSIDNVIAGYATHNFSIGARDDGSVAEFFDGYIYQPIVFTREISGAEALEIYTYGIKGAD